MATHDFSRFHELAEEFDGFEFNLDVYSVGDSILMFYFEVSLILLIQ